MRRPRSDGVILLHGPSSKARRAARTARLMSSTSPSAMLARVSPVAGLGVSNVLPEAASTHCPLMKSCRGAAMKSSTRRSRVTVMDAHLPYLRGGAATPLRPARVTARGAQPAGCGPLGSHHETTAGALAQGGPKPDGAESAGQLAESQCWTLGQGR